MTKAIWVVCALSLLGVPMMSGCEKTATAKITVEKLAEVKPSLPAVPTIPPPPFPLEYDDHSFSVFGLRRKLAHTINQDVTVTGFIAKVFVPPVCEKGAKCPTPAAPHIWVADTVSETETPRLLLVAGYAENQAAIDEAVKAAERGKPIIPPEETGLLPVPTDFNLGAKIKIKGRFAYISGSGFQSSQGVLEYRGHETLQPAPEQSAQK